MEETVINESPVQSVEQPREEISQVSFPSNNAPKKKGGFGKVIIILLGLAILGVIGFLVFKGVGEGSAEPTSTPSVESLSGSSEDTFNSDATPTPEPVNKSEVSIKVLNGTGISGEAGYLQDILKSMDYAKIEVGNASSQDNEVTQVVFASDLSQEIVDEITNKLEALYKDVKTTTSSSAKVDVEITTGLRKGATPKPSSSPKASPTASPSATPQV